MRSRFQSALSVLIVALSAFVSSCADLPDLYSEVAAPCNYQVEPSVKNLIQHGYRTLKPECKEALLKVLDSKITSNFDNAPAFFLDFVLEGFQALVAYPIEVPKARTILGMSPGSLPPWFAYYAENGGPNPNQNLFNYVANQFDIIDYAPKYSSRASYSAFSKVSGLNSKVTFYDAFQDTPVMLRAAILLHEARHMDGNPHVTCDSGPEKGKGNCDPDLNGAVGFEVAYLVSLLHGSYGKYSGNSVPYLGNWDLFPIAKMMCMNLREISGSGVEGALPGEIYEEIKGPRSCLDDYFGIEWLLQHEKLVIEGATESANKTDQNLTVFNSFLLGSRLR